VGTSYYNVCVSASPPVLAEAETQSTSYTLRQRVALWLVTWAGYLAIRLIGPTLKFAVSFEPGAPTSLEERPFVYSFWHNCVFPAAYLWRKLNIRVMTSQSFDGEYIARIIQRFGFVPVRGSSTRGGVRALLSMRRETDQGWTVAFTIDGPRGPRYIAKPGPVLLARATGVPMVVFHIALEKAWILNTWDEFMIPKPFSRALMRVSCRMPVRPEASDAEMERLHGELQGALDRVREFAESNVTQVGKTSFPQYPRRT
jgi:lysophospholipid acyltransferase (LPLAT)-like uncharacterized protein